VSTYLAAVVAVGNFVKAGYTSLPVYIDPTEAPTPADVATGFVELTWHPGKKGPLGGRFGNATYYFVPGTFTLSIFIPRARGTGPAWAALDALEALLLEAVIGDMYIDTCTPVMRELQETDTHVQLDVIFSYDLEAFKPT